MTDWYKDDLAYIHDVGYAAFALKSAPGILDTLRRHKIQGGLVVDLGCGSGLLARALTDAGYQLLGVDISEAMIRIAQSRVPEAEFRLESLFSAELPPCDAVTSISECLNYLFDTTGGNQALPRLFRRIYKALNPGGVFVFDMGGPGQVEPGVRAKGFSEGEDWVVLVEKEEDENRSLLTRRIISFRKVGSQYRRSDETHVQRLYRAADVAAELRKVGFRVRIKRGYGDYPLPKSHAAFVARKPL